MTKKLLDEALDILDADGFRSLPYSAWWNRLERAARTHVYKGLQERHSNEAITRHVEAIADLMTMRIAEKAETRRAILQKEN